ALLHSQPPRQLVLTTCARLPKRSFKTLNHARPSASSAPIFSGTRSHRRHTTSRIRVSSLVMRQPYAKQEQTTKQKTVPLQSSFPQETEMRTLRSILAAFVALLFVGSPALSSSHGGAPVMTSHGLFVPSLTHGQIADMHAHNLY